MTTEHLFWICLLMLAYAYAGYPLLIASLARLRRRPVVKRPQLPSVSLILVANNDARWIEDKLANCLTLDYPHDLLKVVVVCDGSNDDTAARVRGFESPRIRLLTCDRAHGRAACLNKAVMQASGDVLIFTDVRRRLDRNAVHALVRNFADPSVGAVSGDLLRDAPDLYWRYERFVRMKEAEFSSSIAVTTGLYAIRRELYGAMPEPAGQDDVLVPMNVARRGYRVVFEREAIAYETLPSREQRRAPRVRPRIHDGGSTPLAPRLRLLDPFRNPLWFQYLSHRLLRVMTPLFMAGALLASGMLAAESLFYRAVFAAQLALYAAALAGILLPAARRLRLIRVSSTILLFAWFALLDFFGLARQWRKQP